jgi:hypothetical protein
MEEGTIPTLRITRSVEIELENVSESIMKSVLSKVNSDNYQSIFVESYSFKSTTKGENEEDYRRIYPQITSYVELADSSNIDFLMYLLSNPIYFTNTYMNDPDVIKIMTEAIKVKALRYNYSESTPNFIETDKWVDDEREVEAMLKYIIPKYFNTLLNTCVREKILQSSILRYDINVNSDNNGLILDSKDEIGVLLRGNNGSRKEGKYEITLIIKFESGIHNRDHIELDKKTLNSFIMNLLGMSESDLKDLDIRAGFTIENKPIGDDFIGSDSGVVVAE